MDGESTVYKADVINISAGGVCLLRSAVLEKGDIIHLRFPFKTKKILLSARVIRVDGKEVGIKFLNTDDQIEKFIAIFNVEYPHLKKGYIEERKGLFSNGDAVHSPGEEKLKEDFDDMFDIESD